MLEQQVVLSQNGETMKPLLGKHKYSLIVGILGCGLIISYAQQQKPTGKTGKVEITADSIVIHSPVKLSEKDEQKLAQALATSDKSLYKLQTFENGRVKTEGNLKINTVLEQEMANAKANHASGFCVNFIPGSPAYVAVTRQLEAKRLHEKIKPILEKYQ